MQRKVLFAALAALMLAGGCAKSDPNLTVRSLSEYGHSAGDYTMSLKTYALDAEGRVAPAVADAADASLAGFVTRTLAAKGYTLKPAGPARYGLEVHLLCADTRVASLGFMAEELRLPVQGVAGYSEQVHFWLPEQQAGMGQQMQDAQERRDVVPRGRDFGGIARPGQGAMGGTPMGRTQPDHCQGRVLLVLTPAGAGPAREVFVGRAATDDCAFASGCPVGACRNALERSLVEILERRF